MVESFDEAIPFLIIFAMWGLLWPRHLSIQIDPRSPTQTIGLAFFRDGDTRSFVYLHIDQMTASVRKLPRSRFRFAPP